MPPSRRGRLERTPMGLSVSADWSTRRHVLALPATAAELAAQLRDIVPHHRQCRWATHPRSAAGQTLAQAEAARCTCTAVPHRQHLTDVVRAAAAGQLPPEVTR